MFKVVCVSFHIDLPIYQNHKAYWGQVVIFSSINPNSISGHAVMSNDIRIMRGKMYHYFIQSFLRVIKRKKEVA